MRKFYSPDVAAQSAPQGTTTPNYENGYAGVSVENRAAFAIIEMAKLAATDPVFRGLLTTAKKLENERLEPFAKESDVDVRQSKILKQKQEANDSTITDEIVAKARKVQNLLAWSASNSQSKHKNAEGDSIRFVHMRDFIASGNKLAVSKGEKGIAKGSIETAISRMVETGE